MLKEIIRKSVYIAAGKIQLFDIIVDARNRSEIWVVVPLDFFQAMLEKISQKNEDVTVWDIEFFEIVIYAWNWVYEFVSHQVDNFQSVLEKITGKIPQIAIGNVDGSEKNSKTNRKTFKTFHLVLAASRPRPHFFNANG